MDSMNWKEEEENDEKMNVQRGRSKKFFSRHRKEFHRDEDGASLSLHHDWNDDKVLTYQKGDGRNRKEFFGSKKMMNGKKTGKKEENLRSKEDRFFMAGNGKKRQGSNHRHDHHHKNGSGDKFVHSHVHGHYGGGHSTALDHVMQGDEGKERTELEARNEEMNVTHEINDKSGSKLHPWTPSDQQMSTNDGHEGMLANGHGFDDQENNHHHQGNGDGHQLNGGQIVSGHQMNGHQGKNHKNGTTGGASGHYSSPTSGRSLQLRREIIEPIPEDGGKFSSHSNNISIALVQWTPPAVTVAWDFDTFKNGRNLHTKVIPKKLEAFRIAYHPVHSR